MIAFNIARPTVARPRGSTVTPLSKERLYKIKYNEYLQHRCDDPIPEQLNEYVAQHGEFPPYIPLPHEPVEFHIGPTLLHWVAYQWQGKGLIPSEVMEYVVEHGKLPPSKNMKAALRWHAVRESFAAEMHIESAYSDDAQNEPDDAAYSLDFA